MNFRLLPKLRSRRGLVEIVPANGAVGVGAIGW